ncbi:MAG: hypothetical protein K9N46_05405 [Candidatus Marinimicrobia bacterium]|nr:hypothetical protein [Candidatus Neomarinimicrobiota bacterium]MCF7880159.1 hypothetical protein [Candidatus Neomarinimicrobiota bacterium]
MHIKRQHVEQASKVSNLVGAALYLGVQVYDLVRGNGRSKPVQTPDES